MKDQPIFALGQRWLSDTEPDLGLGLVTEVDGRTVTIEFRSVNESRRYAQTSAPLTRLVLKTGDNLALNNIPGSDTTQTALTLDVIETGNSTVIYIVELADGSRHPLPEALLPDNLSMNRPLDRLLSGQFDTHHWFYLKQQSLNLLSQAQDSGLMGLSSARAELIPHQLYIADEVARRYAPRVMLADEVGLGKTIEAGLILQQQLVSGLVSRVLIVVPEALLHQWLVEMLRRFNLQFTLLDRERCHALRESDQHNPFSSAQLVLSPLSLFTEHPEWMSAAEQAGWDLCIVDEAHHIELGETEMHGAQAPDIADAYGALSRLATATRGLLLLSATPEQLGPENYFALLRLLDPARFISFEDFVSEQARYREVAEKIQQLPENAEEVRELLDQHGTGRILFRNTRRVLTGFPERHLHIHQLAPLPAEGDDLDTDPRVSWLTDWLKSQDSEGKVLLICAQDVLAIALEKHLRLKVGIRSSVFHRHMSLLERDRAAAYFAGENTGHDEVAARILVCSEIGSEGRNFQFCRHLVLFDLPLNPDLLEQRIGRLDRIGQRHDIQIHVPCVTGSRQELLARWYHQGLQAFEQISPAAYQLWQTFSRPLQTCLDSPSTTADEFTELLSTVAATRKRLEKELEHGRDILLERNSFNAERAGELVSAIRDFEQRCNPQTWLLNVLDRYSVFHEFNNDGSVSIVPSEDMLLPAFPGLPDDGFDACFQRDQAVRREDRAYLSWQHPMIVGALDLVLDTHQGKAAISAIRAEVAATLMPRHHHCPIFAVECLFRIKTTAPAVLQLSKYLPASSINLTLGLDHNEEVRALHLDTSSLGASLMVPDKSSALQVLSEHHKLLLQIIEQSAKMADNECRRITAAAAKTMLEKQTLEIRRLLALKQRNPNIRQEEIDYLKDQTLALHKCMDQGEAELIAVHVILSA